MEVIIGTLDGNKPSFHCDDNEEQQWIDNNSTLFSDIKKLSDLFPRDYNALCFPSGAGKLKKNKNNNLKLKKLKKKLKLKIIYKRFSN